MSKSTGTIIKYIIIAVIIGLLGFSLFWKFYLNGKTIEEDNVQKLPQCSDGKDNDGDGFVDMQDQNCASPDDKFERDFSWLKWIFGFILLIGIIYAVWYFATKKKDKDDDEDGIVPEPVDSHRGFELVKSHLLRYKFKDIPSRVIKVEKDEFLILEPFQEDAIEVENEYFDVNRNTGERFHFWFISVLIGKWAGHHLVAVSLSKGEKFIKGGNIRFETGTWIGNFTKKIQNFNMSSPQGEKQRLELLKLDAIREGDKDTLAETQNLLNSLGGSNSAFADEDEEMWKERIRLGQSNSKKKSNKSNKKVANTTNTTPDMNLEGGDE